MTALPPWVVEQTYTARDTMLYALGIGAGSDLAHLPGEIDFVYEKHLIALPTMAAVLGYPGFWARDPKYRITWQKLVHTEQSIVVHSPLPMAGRVRGTTRISDIYDKGEKGALLYTETILQSSESGEKWATIRRSSLLRADGGFAPPDHHARLEPPVPHSLPERPVDQTIDLATRPEQAMIYRLSGDDNPLHIDPDIAAAAGFARPILHGLATYGVACRAIAALLCAGDPARINRFDVRFSSPVYPGETIRVDLWHERPGVAALRASVVERNIPVLQNGYVEFAESVAPTIASP